MPFLLGAFGPIAHSSQGKQLAATAVQHAKETSLHSTTFTEGCLYAGYKHDETVITDKILSLPASQGTFVGRMFDREHYASAVFNDEDVHEITNDAKLVLKKWWGRYVGVLYNPTTHRCTLLRDPQGLSTLFYSIKPDGIIFSTDLAILYDALDAKPSLHLSYFAEYVVNKNQLTLLTPFHEIKELAPGMAMHLSPQGTCEYQYLWDLSSCTAPYSTDEKAFEEELLGVLKLSVKAWASESTGICLELSGGTDSSAMMILLRDAYPAANIVGINYFDSKTPSSNEIEYAQEVAQLCDVPLQFIDWQSSSLLDAIPSHWRPDKPTTFLLFYNACRQLREITAHHKYSDIINGQGGDHVFLAPPPNDALADYWLDKGLGGISYPLRQLSSANRAPWRKLMRNAINDIACYYLGRENRPYDEAALSLSQHETTFLNASYLYKPQEHEFFLNSQLQSFYPGKKNHVKYIFHAVPYADRNQRISGFTMTHPLLSQPVIELALKIPTYQSFADGYDRIFFRRSVSRVKNSRALWRTEKGETTGSMTKSFAQHASQVHDILLQGRLVKDGLVNGAWLDEQMGMIRHGHVINLWPVIHLLTAQLWLNQWKL